MLPNPASAFYGGPLEFQLLALREQASSKDEIVAVVPLKAEGAPVPGAGFSPEAVPGKSAETENTRTVSHFFGVDQNVDDSIAEIVPPVRAMDSSRTDKAMRDINAGVS